MDTAPKQGTENSCRFRKRVLRPEDLSGYWGYNPHFPERWRALVSSKYSVDNIAVGKKVNLAFAVYVTTQSWLKIYVCLGKMGSLFCNVIQTRSSSFRKIMTPKSKHGIIWATSDELENYGSCSFVEEFVSCGPKNYAFSVFWPSTWKRATNCKMKDITLNYVNLNVVNLAILRVMIIE